MAQKRNAILSSFNRVIFIGYGYNSNPGESNQQNKLTKSNLASNHKVFFPSMFLAIRYCIWGKCHGMENFSEFTE